MIDIKSGNIPSLSVGKIVETLSSAYAGIIEKGLPVKIFPSVMLWGAPGVGKSQAVRQIAKEIETRTGKRVFVTDVRLLLFNPIDLRGIPTANAEKTLAVWLKPRIFQMDESENAVNILFLDEISAAPQSVQAAAYQITLDRVIGEHKLPENCIVIAAGNRVTDRSVAYKMPKALANRLMHFEVSGNFESWKRWAVEKGINEKITGFLSARRDYLFGFDFSSDDLAFPTPRSWEMVDTVLKIAGGDVGKAFDCISGIVGSGIAAEFKSWAKIYADLPKIEDIFEGKFCIPPKGADALYALCSSMTCYAKEHKNELDKIANSIAFAQSLPPDFSAMLLKDYMYIEKGYKEKLMRIPEFYSWLSTKGKLLNGNI